MRTNPSNNTPTIEYRKPDQSSFNRDVAPERPRPSHNNYSVPSNPPSRNNNSTFSTPSYQSGKNSSTNNDNSNNSRRR